MSLGYGVATAVNRKILRQALSVAAGLGIVTKKSRLSSSRARDSLRSNSNRLFLGECQFMMTAVEYLMAEMSRELQQAGW